MAEEKLENIERKNLGYPPRKELTLYDKLIELGETGIALDIARKGLQRQYAIKN